MVTLRRATWNSLHSTEPSNDDAGPWEIYLRRVSDVSRIGAVTGTLASFSKLSGLRVDVRTTVLLVRVVCGVVSCVLKPWEQTDELQTRWDNID